MKTHSSHLWPWIILVIRLVMFVGIQAIFALGFLRTGIADPWESAANWWLFGVTITNLFCVTLLVRLFSQEGGRFWDVFCIQKDHIKTDLLTLLGILMLLGPASRVSCSATKSIHWL